MWPKPSRKKGKSQGTKSRLKALKEDKSEQSEESSSSARSEKRKTRPPNRNRKKAGELEKRKDRKKQDTKARLKSQRASKAKLNTVSQKKAAKQEPKPEPVVEETNQPKQHESDSVNLWKEKILSAYKGNPKDSRGLLASVPNKKAQFEAGERQKLELIEESMIKVVDKMFDNFQNTAYGFNQVTQGSDLELVWIRPSIVNESQGNWVDGNEGLNVFSGRISTRYWTLVIRGSINSIVSYILPADKLLSFGSSAFDFDPYAEIVPESDGMSVNWFIKGKEITQDLFPNVFRALLDGLIRYANEEAEPNESFRLEDIGFAPEPKPEPEEIPQHLDEGEPELLSMDEEKKKSSRKNLKKTMLNQKASELEPTVEIAQAQAELEQNAQPLEQELPPQQAPLPVEQAAPPQQAPLPVEQAAPPQQAPLPVEQAPPPQPAPVEQAPPPPQAPQPQQVPQPQQMQEPPQAPTPTPPKPAQKPHVELAIEEAFELASNKATEERMRQQQDMVDPGAGFIQSVSSQLANQATQETDMIRESISEDAASGAFNQVSDQDAIEQTGQWKLVGSNLPPAVASQWQNYVKNTGDEVGAGQIPNSSPQAPPNPQEDQWNSFDGEVNQMPAQSQDSGAWVHPSQQIQAANQQYQEQNPIQNVPQQAMQPEYDDEETIEFNSDSGHSHYLLTEEDIDDRAIQTPPPDVNMAPGALGPGEAAPAEDESVSYQVEEEAVYEEGVEYEVEETEEYEYEEHTYEIPQSESTLVGALSQVVTTIDSKVEILSQKGAEAFSNKDFKRAEVIIKLSERLNDFKEEANLLLSILGDEEE